MRLRFSRPSLLVDIGRLDDLRYVRESGDRIAIGALTRHAELARDPLLAEHCALIGETAALIGDPQVRHRGTIGGSVAHGDPASDLGTILLTLDAELVARGPQGERTIPAADVLHRPVRQPRSSSRRCSPRSACRRPPGRISSTCGVRTTGRRSASRRRVSTDVVQVGLTSMGPTPLRARSVEAALAGGASPADAAAHAADDTDAAGGRERRAAEYRAHLAQVLVRRALETL